MKTRFIVALAIGAGSIAGAGTRASAQDSTRTYDLRALRFETSWGNVQVIRGANGAVVATSGWFRDFDIEKLLASSPQAAAEARVYQTNNFRGSLVGGIGAATTVAGILITANSSNSASSPVMIIGGVGAMVWGAQHLSRSYAALSRALWWYNRDLSR